MDVSRSSTWVSLGKLIPTTQQLDVQQAPPSTTPSTEAKGKREQATACIMGRRYTRKQCFIRALEIDNEDHEAWFLLGKCIEDFEQDPCSPQGGPKWSPNPCIEVPLWTPAPTPGSPRLYGSSLLDQRGVISYFPSDATTPVRKVTHALFSKQQCFVRALECALNQLEAMRVAAEARVRAQDGTEGLLVLAPNPGPIWLAVSNTLVKRTRLDPPAHQDVLASSVGSIKGVANGPSTHPDTATDYVTVLGKVHDKLACAKCAVEADPLLGNAWNALGIALTRGDTVELDLPKVTSNDEPESRLELLSVRTKIADLSTVSERTTVRVGKLECFIKALERGEEGNTKVWTNTAALMGIQQVPTVEIQGKARSKADCYAMAIRLGDSNSMAWLGLGLSLNPPGMPQPPLSVDIGAVTRLHCLRRSVEADVYNSRAWVDLGIEVSSHTTLNTAAKGVRILAAERIAQTAKTRNLPCPRTIADPVRRGGFTAKDCYVRALELNSSIAEAWSRLGMLLSGTLTQDAIEGAMNMDVDTKVAEVLRMAKLRKTVEVEKEKKLKEVAKMKRRVEKEIASGAEDDRSNSSPSTKSSSSSSSSSSASTTESELADRTAFVEERRWVHNYTRAKAGKTALSGIYTAYSLLESVTIRGRPVTKVDCHLRCLELEPLRSRSWCNMGTGCAYVAGAAKQLDLFIKAWKMDNPTASDSRSEVEDDDTDDGDVDEDNFDGGSDEEATSHRPIRLSKTAIGGVVGSLEQELEGVLPGREGSYYSQRRCYVRAVEIDPTASIAWSGLAMTLKLRPYSGVEAPPAIPVASARLQEDPCTALVKLASELVSVDRVECFARAAADPHECARAELWLDLGDCLARPHVDPYTLAITGYVPNSRIITVVTPADLSDIAGATSQPAERPTTQRVSALHCFCKAVQLDPDSAMAWYRLGLELLHLQQETDPSIKRLTSCCAIPADEVELTLLRALERGLVVDGTNMQLSAHHCFAAAVEVCMSNNAHLSPVRSPLAPQIPAAEFNLFGACWTYAGVSLTQGRMSRCKPWKKGSGVAVDRQGAYFQALEFDPNVKLAWRELGDLLVDGWFTYNTVSIRGREYTKRECTEKSLTL